MLEAFDQGIMKKVRAAKSAIAAEVAAEEEAAEEEDHTCAESAPGAVNVQRRTRSERAYPVVSRYPGYPDISRHVQEVLCVSMCFCVSS